MAGHRIPLATPVHKPTFVSMGGDWRRGFEFAWQAPGPEPDEGPGLTWRETGMNYWSTSWGSQPRGTRHARDVGPAAC
jgi:hypothetical protein